MKVIVGIFGATILGLASLQGLSLGGGFGDALRPLVAGHIGGMLPVLGGVIGALLLAIAFRSERDGLRGD